MPLAQRIIAQARGLYANESLGADLKDSVYALDSTTIDLCLSIFPWAAFRSAKAAVKMHTLLDLRGGFRPLSMFPMASCTMSTCWTCWSGSWRDLRHGPGYIDFARLYGLHQAGAFFVTRAKSNLKAHRVYSAPSDRQSGVIADQSPDGLKAARIIPPTCGASAS